MVAGVNDRCWLLELNLSNTNSSSTPSLALLRTIQADCSASDDGYVRVVRLAQPAGRSFLAGGSEGIVREFGVPDMKLMRRIESLESAGKIEVLDVDVKGEDRVVVFEDDSRRSHLNLPGIEATRGYSIKFARYLGTHLLLVENPVHSKDRKANQKRSPYLSILDLTGKSRQSFLLTPASKNCTCVSVEGKWIALGFADGSLLVLLASDPRQVFFWAQSLHSFPVTGLAVDEEARVLISVAADGVLKVNRLRTAPGKLSGSDLGGITLRIAMIAVVLAILIALTVAFVDNHQSKLPVDETADFDAFYTAISHL